MVVAVLLKEQFIHLLIYNNIIPKVNKLHPLAGATILILPAPAVFIHLHHLHIPLPQRRFHHLLFARSTSPFNFLLFIIIMYYVHCMLSYPQKKSVEVFHGMFMNNNMLFMLWCNTTITLFMK